MNQGPIGITLQLGYHLQHFAVILRNTGTTMLRTPTCETTCAPRATLSTTYVTRGPRSTTERVKETFGISNVLLLGLTNVLCFWPITYKSVGMYSNEKKRCASSCHPRKSEYYQ